MQQLPTFALAQAIDCAPLLVEPGTSLSEVVELMSQASVKLTGPSHSDPLARDDKGQVASKDVSCVLVAQNGQPSGIITEKDIVRLVAEGRSLTVLSVAEVMSQPVITLTAAADSDIFTALAVMRRHKIHHLPVVDDEGQLLGLLTPRRLRSVLAPAEFMRFRRVHEVISPQTIHAPPTASLRHVVRQLVEHKVSCVVIVQPEGRAAEQLMPIGIITERDVVQFQRLGLNLETTQAKAVMSTPLFLVNPQDSLWSVDKTMRQHRVRRLVVANDAGHLVGVVTQGQLLPIDPVEMYEVLELLQDKVAQLEAEKHALLEQQNQELAQAVAQKTSRLERQETLLNRLALGTGIEAGDNFWPLIIAYLTEAIAADIAFVGQCQPNNRLMTLAVQKGGQPAENFTYHLEGTPCAEALAQQSCIYPQKVKQQFPHDAVLQAIEVEGYLGMALHNTSGEVIGLLAVLTQQPMTDVDFKQEVLSIFAARASAELERQTVRIQQMQTEKEIRQSEREYRTLAENLPGIAYRVFPEDGNRMAFLNNQCQQMTGYNAEELSAGEVCYIDQLILPEDRSRVIATVKAAIAHQDSFQLEYRIKAKTGDIRYFWEKGQTIANTPDRPVHVDGVIFDITERKLAELSIQESQQRLNNILESSQDVVWSSTVDSSQMLYMSPSAEVTYGRSPAEFFNNPNLWTEVVHPDDRSRVDAFFEEIFEQGQADCEYRILRPDGTVCWLLDRTWLIHDENGEPTRLDGVSTNITDRILSQQKIAEQAALLNVANDAIIVRSMTGEILFWNKGAETIYGWTAEEAEGQPINQLLCPSNKDGEEILQSLLLQGHWQSERQQVTKAGNSLIVMSRSSLVIDQQGNPTSILTVNTNITEQKRLEAQFLRAQRLESLGTLASGIAHDLNNIMTPILGVAQLLPMQMPDLSEHIRSELNVLQTSAERGSEIIGQVLSFARGAEGERAALNIKHLISEIKDFARKTFPKSLTISVDIPNDLWTIEGDATKLYQVFMNLFVNARDAMPQGGELSVLATNLTLDPAFAAHHLDAETGPHIMLTVADTGKGIPPDVLDRIFEPFFTTKKADGGTGLGLSTVHGIVRSHGGFVTVYSEVGQGSQFKVYLPAIAQTAQTPSKAPTAALSGQGELVLVVDDEEPILAITRGILEVHNYRVITATDGIDAIAQYTEHKANISVTLMDITMPNLDGATAIQIMQKVNPELKVIVTSGMPGNLQATPLMGDSVKTFLQKPYSPERLLQSVQSVLQNSVSDSSL